MLINTKALLLALLGLILLSILIAFILPAFAIFYYLPGWTDFYRIVTDVYTLSIAKFALTQALFSSLISIVTGIIVARSWHRRQFKGRNLYLLLVSIPIVMPVVLAVSAFFYIYGGQGWLTALFALFNADYDYQMRGMLAVIIVHVYFNAALSVRIFIQSLEKIPDNYWRLASGFQLSSWQLFRRVEWPVIKQQIPGLFTLIFLLCFTAFASVLMLSANPLQSTFEVAIYQSLRYDSDYAAIACYGLLQLSICFVVYCLIYRMKPADVFLPVSSKNVMRPDSGSTRLKLFDGIVLIVFFAYCLLPLLAILLSALNFNAWKVMQLGSFYQALYITIKVAVGTAVCSVLVGTGVAYCQFYLQQYLKQLYRKKQDQPVFSTSVLRLISFMLDITPKLTLVVPSIMLIAGIFLLFDTILIANGSLLLIALNAIWMLPFVIRIVMNQLPQIHRYRLLCQSLGMQGYHRFKQVDWPLIKKSVGLGLAIAMAFSLGDFSVIAVLNNENLITLPMFMYQLMASYKMPEARVVAFIIACLMFISFAVCFYLFNIDADAAAKKKDNRIKPLKKSVSQ